MVKLFIGCKSRLTRKETMKPILAGTIACTGLLATALILVAAVHVAVRALDESSTERPDDPEASGYLYDSEDAFWQMGDPIA